VTITEAKVRKVLLLAVGAFEAAKGAEALGFIEITEQQAQAGELPNGCDDVAMLEMYDRHDTLNILRFEAKAVSAYMGGTAGTIYSVDSPKPGTIRSGSAQVFGQWPSTGDRAILQARSTAVRRDLAARKHGAKLAKEDALVEGIAPLRVAYKRAVGAHRAQFLAYVVEQITK
jgi:hypothetical protein